MMDLSDPNTIISVCAFVLLCFVLGSLIRK